MSKEVKWVKSLRRNSYDVQERERERNSNLVLRKFYIRIHFCPMRLVKLVS